MTAPSSSGPPWRPGATLTTLRLRAHLLQRTRAFFATREVLEVETPLLGHAGAADAQLAQFDVRLAQGETLYLQTSPEYAMKRLLAAGSGSIYQICKAFRAGEKGQLHNPEFTLVEWYRTGFTQRALIDETCALIGDLFGRALRAPRLLSYREAFLQALAIDPFVAPDRILADWARRHDPGAATLTLDRDGWLDFLFSMHVAPSFPRDRLTVIQAYPSSQAAWARTEGDTAARFEIYFGATELANGFHEATEWAVYKARFDEQERRRRAHGLPLIPADVRLLAALAEGDFPDCAGVALGFDRIVMLAAGAGRLDEVISFTIDRI
ncbi:MAG: EF-P lysine aminoacylase EpmA [Gammaproteobacteria bacterium]|nr:EF-P lysine aminoacylase EpmA [Gammaproteobacteria bacterium]